MRTIWILTLAACAAAPISGDTDADTDVELTVLTDTGACGYGEAVAWRVPPGTVAVTVYVCVEDNGASGAEPTEECWDRDLDMHDVGADGYLRFDCVNNGDLLGPFWRVEYVAPSP